MVTVMME